MTKTYRIGCSLVLSGHERVHGEAMARAVGLAVEQANADRARRFDLELVVADDCDEPGPAREKAAWFSEMMELMGVVGPMNSHAALAAGPAYEAAGLAHLSPAASNPSLSRRGLTAFFRMVADDEQQGRAAAEFAVNRLGKRRLAVIHDGSLFGRPLAEVFSRRARELGAEVGDPVVIGRGRKDYSRAAALAAAREPELIFFGVIEEEGLILAPQLRRAGADAVFFGADGLKASRYLATPEHPAPGPFHTNACCDPDRSHWAREFRDAYVRRFGRSYSVYTAEAYDAARLIIAAMAGCERISRQATLAALKAMPGTIGVTGPIAFTDRGDRVNPSVGVYELTPGNGMLYRGADTDDFTGGDPAGS